jgi:hypothetical protein
MRLFEHPDFDQAVIRAAEDFRPRGLRESQAARHRGLTLGSRASHRYPPDPQLHHAGQVFGLIRRSGDRARWGQPRDPRHGPLGKILEKNRTFGGPTAIVGV